MTTLAPSNRLSSVCLIVGYFGKLPPYVDCFFRSCAGNPDVNWLLLTDDPTEYRLPPNVRRELVTLAELREQFSATLGFPAALWSPYKLCDFRPAFGRLFQAQLAGYDFWGHCDLDQIFGCLRPFLRSELLAAYDRVFTRGHLSLYRNTSRVNELFQLQVEGVPGFDKVFTNPQHFQFDEWPGIYTILRKHGIPQHHEEIAIDVRRPTRWRYTRFNGYEVTNFSDQVFYWHQGRLFQAYRLPEGAVLDREFAYLHFQRRPLPAPNFDPWQTTGFLITPQGFLPYDREPLSRADFVQYNASQWRPWGEIRAKISKRLLRAFSVESSPGSQPHPKQPKINR